MRKLQRLLFAMALVSGLGYVLATVASSTAAPARATVAAAGGGLGTGAVTNYVKYVDGKAGAANNEARSGRDRLRQPAGRSRS